MRKGLEMTTVNIVILAVAIALLALLVWKLIPAFGSLISNKLILCKSMGMAGWLFGC